MMKPEEEASLLRDELIGVPEKLMNWGKIRMIVTRNPATEEVISEYPTLSAAELDSRIDRSASAFETWKSTSIEHRAELLRRIAAEIRNSLEDSARMISIEMGKPLSEARAEVEKCATGCEFYAEHGPGFLANEEVETDASKSYVRFDPLGCVLAVMPWNFPFWQVLRFAAPTLLAGNVGLLKHASNVTGCALEIEKILHRAGVPEDVFQTLVIPSSDVASVIENRNVRAVSLTGSEAAGSAVAEVAGKHLKKLVLELGGSDPFIVLEDADLEKVIPKAVQSRTMNAGQSCIAAKRFLVVQSVYPEFVERLTEAMREIQVGDPLDASTKMGPLAREDLVEDLDQQVKKSISQGAQLMTGGKKLDRPGHFYAPTVLAGATTEMTCLKEETFGPVASVASVANADEAVRIANSSKYGLGGSIWSQDISRAEQIAAQIESGSVFINEFTKSDPKVPFGGVKDSGYGRELSVFGIREFVNTKTVWIA